MNLNINHYRILNLMRKWMHCDPSWEDLQDFLYISATKSDDEWTFMSYEPLPSFLNTFSVLKLHPFKRLDLTVPMKWRDFSLNLEMWRNYQQIFCNFCLLVGFHTFAKQQIIRWNWFSVRLPVINAWNYCQSLYTAFSENVGAWGMWACSLFLFLYTVQTKSTFLKLFCCFFFSL